MYGISRIDDDEYRTHAWRVSLRRRHILHVKNFADKKCGGKRKALLLAQAYRDELIREIAPLSRKEFSGIRRRNNRTGVVGVCRYSKKYTLKNGTVRYSWYWEAIWPTTPAKSKVVRFSVNKFGEAGAFNRARSARIRGFNRIEGVFWPCEESSDIVSRQLFARLRARPGRGQAGTLRITAG
jgi:hypothetical protein